MTIPKKFVYFTWLWLLATLSAVAAEQPLSPLALLGAFPEELAWLDNQVVSRQEHIILGHKFVTGQLAGQEVILTLTGVGKVNAAATTVLLLDHFLPRAVIFSGVAGNLNHNLQPGDVVISQRTVQHDLGDATPSGIENFGVRNPATGVRNPVFFAADSVLLRRTREAVPEVQMERTLPDSSGRIPLVVEGVIATGDLFISSTPAKVDLRRRLNADAVEMEGGAVAQICYQIGVPCLILRAISDHADEHASDDFERYYLTAARNANRVALKLVESLKD